MATVQQSAQGRPAPARRLVLPRTNVLISYVLAFAGLATLTLIPVLVVIEAPLHSLTIGDREIFALSGTDTVAGGTFVATGDNGTTIALSARFLVPGSPGSSQAGARDVVVSLKNGGEVRTSVKANYADIDVASGSVVMTGDAMLESSSGLRLRANSLIVAENEGRISSPGASMFEYPGLLGVAGRLTFEIDSTDPASADLHTLKFEDAVYLVYNSQGSAEK